MAPISALAFPLWAFYVFFGRRLNNREYYASVGRGVLKQTPHRQMDSPDWDNG